jgi:putative transposase
MKRRSPEPTIRKLREAEAHLAEGGTIATVCQKLSISEPTFHRWRNQYGGRKTRDAKRLKELEQENAGRRRAVAQLTLDKQMLQDVVEKKG